MSNFRLGSYKHPTTTVKITSLLFALSFLSLVVFPAFYYRNYYIKYQATKKQRHNLLIIGFFSHPLMGKKLIVLIYIYA